MLAGKIWKENVHLQITQLKGWKKQIHTKNLQRLKWIKINNSNWNDFQIKITVKNSFIFFSRLDHTVHTFFWAFTRFIMLVSKSIFSQISLNGLWFTNRNNPKIVGHKHTWAWGGVSWTIRLYVNYTVSLSRKTHLMLMYGYKYLCNLTYLFRKILE